MSVVFKNNKQAVARVLQIILGIEDLEVVEVNTQEALQNLHGRSVRLDVYAKDRLDNRYDIEIQRSDEGASELRARYYSSLIDADMLKEGQDYKDLHKNYVIFITEHDCFRRGRPIYHIIRKFTDNNENFNDGAHIIYVNGDNKDSSTALGKLMHDFKCKDPEKMNYKELADSVGSFKKAREEEIDMRDVFEEFRLEGIEEGAENKMIEIAEKLITRGKATLEEIAEDTGLSLEQVRELAKSKAS